MPVIKPAASDYTAFVKASAQYVGAGSNAVVSKSGRGMTAPPGLGASVRASFVGLKSSPSTSALILQYVNPPAAAAPAPAPAPAASLYLPNTQANDVYIVKYNTAGEVQWYTTISGTGSDYGYALTTDSTGVYATGFYTSIDLVTLYNGDSGSGLASSGKSLPTTQSNDPYIVKYNTAGVVQWYTTISGTGNDNGYALTTDSTGVYVTGYYTSGSLITLYNGDSGTGRVSSGKSLPTTQSNDPYIVKYNTAGVVQWYTTISGTNSDFGYGLTTDSTGVYATGFYTSGSLITLYNGDSGSGLASSGKSLPTTQSVDAYIVKYNTAGVVQWYTTISGPSGDYGYALTTDSTGVYAAGFYSSIDLVTLYNGDSGSGLVSSDKSLPTTKSLDAYIVKYNTAGEVQWYTTISGTNNDYGYALTTDLTGVYVTGQYTSIDLVTLYNGDSGSGLASSGKSLPTTQSNDVYIVKYTTAGVVQWYTTISGPSGDYGYALTTDSTGVYATGFYNSSKLVTLYNGDSGSGLVSSGKSLPTTQFSDVYIVKYNTAGVVQWYTTISGTNSDFGYGLTTDSTGVYATGFYTSTGRVLLTNGA
jgi:hypothetical protein